MAALTATLGGSITLVVKGAPQFPVYSPEQRIVPGQTQPRAVAIGRVNAQQVSIPIALLGTTKDDMLAQESAIQKLLNVGTTLAVTSRDASAARTLTLLPGGRLITPADDTWAAYRNYLHDARDVIQADAVPFWEGTEVTLYSSGFTAPNLLTLGTVLGDYPTPLALDFSGSSVKINSLFAGLLKPGSACTLNTGALGLRLFKEAEDLTWWSDVGGSTATIVDGGAHGGNAKGLYGNDSGSGWEDTSLDPGTYACIIRHRMQAYGDTATFWLKYSPGDAHHFTLACTATAWASRMLGKTRHPISKVVSGGSYLFPEGDCSGTTAGHAALLDWVALIPTSWGGFIAYSAPLGTHYDNVFFRSDGVYQGDTGTVVRSFANVLEAGPIEASPGVAKLMIVAEDSSSSVSPPLNLTAKYTPRYATV